MTTSATEGVAALRAPRSIFERVLVGVDGSPESIEAARQAHVLAGASGRVELLAAYDVAPPVVGGTGVTVPEYFDEDVQRLAGERALRKAHAALGAADVAEKLVRGCAWDELAREAKAADHLLIAVGSHGGSRTAGIIVGSTATEIIHNAPCSVLIARSADQTFPSRIVVGVDGSPQSAAAYVAARELAHRFGAQLWPVVAHGGKAPDKRLVDLILDHHREESPDDPVQALVAASTESDLVVVGSRGLHGLKSLGSVSERVAHRARCSTLIVRETPAQEIALRLAQEEEPR